MRKLRLGLALLAAAVAIGGCEPKVDVAAKADEVRAALLSAVTKSDFVRIAVQQGLTCYETDSTRVSCTWHEPDRFSLESLIPCGVTPGMVSAHATFVDGMRQGDYVVEDDYTGC